MHYNYSTSTREPSVCFVLSVVVIYFYPSVICRFFALELDLADLGQAGFYHWEKIREL